VVIEDFKLQYTHQLHILEIDYYIREDKLGLEYQGEVHYFDITHYGAAQAQSATDAIKSLACAIEGITLIEIPFWQIPDLKKLTQTIEHAAKCRPE